MLEIKYSDIVLDNISLFKGAITENYVATQLVSNKISLYYWLSDGIAEVDFLLYNEDRIIPVEVKAADNTQSKSLKHTLKIITLNMQYASVPKTLGMMKIVRLNQYHFMLHF